MLPCKLVCQFHSHRRETTWIGENEQTIWNTYFNAYAWGQDVKQLVGQMAQHTTPWAIKTPANQQMQTSEK